MRIKNVMFVAMVILFFAACNETGKTDGSSQKPDSSSSPALATGSREKALYTETMNIHNEVMEKMGKLKGYEKKVQQQSDSIKAMLACTDFAMPIARRIAGDLDSLNRLGKKLQAADSAMFAWMEQANWDPQLASTEANADYFEKQKKSAEVMKQQFVGALEAAEKKFGPQ